MQRSIQQRSIAARAAHPGFREASHALCTAPSATTAQRASRTTSEFATASTGLATATCSSGAATRVGIARKGVSTADRRRSTEHDENSADSVAAVVRLRCRGRARSHRRRRRRQRGRRLPAVSRGVSGEHAVSSRRNALLVLRDLHGTHGSVRLRRLSPLPVPEMARRMHHRALRLIAYSCVALSLAACGQRAGGTVDSSVDQQGPSPSDIGSPDATVIDSSSGDARPPCPLRFPFGESCSLRGQRCYYSPVCEVDDERICECVNWSRDSNELRWGCTPCRDR